LLRQGHEIGAHSVHHREPFLSNDPKGGLRIPRNGLRSN
jgi:peptidoglycan/xylan/chitin deacetylase (PgdA/CDA1 family)